MALWFLCRSLALLRGNKRCERERGERVTNINRVKQRHGEPKKDRFRASSEVDRSCETSRGVFGLKVLSAVFLQKWIITALVLRHYLRLYEQIRRVRRLAAFTGLYAAFYKSDLQHKTGRGHCYSNLNKDEGLKANGNGQYSEENFYGNITSETGKYKFCCICLKT